MISAKEAVKIAFSYIRDIFPDEQKFELEEVEYSDDSQDWSITISFPDKITTGGGLAALQNIISTPRKYKSILVNASTGSVDAMKIRSLA